MKYLATICKELKKDFKTKNTDFTKPVSTWSEKDIIKDEIVDAFVIIFKTRGCSWALKSGCSMCGYFNDSAWKKVNDTDLLEQYNKAMERYKDQRFVKIFNSGSFLDDTEIKENVRTKILKDLSKKAEKISFESRPEYITKNSIKKIKDILKENIIEIGIGLETADDKIRKEKINKGFSFKEYKKATDILKENNIKIKTYVLIKPPHLTEKESIEDAIKTVKKIKDITDTISFNPCNVQNKTYVNYLWKEKKYRPPWLFSIIEILKESKKIVGNKVRLKCDISGGGNIRGAHNCRECDKNFLKVISDFSINQNTKIFENLKCHCIEKYKDQLELEEFGYGSLVNIYG